MNTFVFTDKDFDLKHTFDCGQCFRWEEDVDGSFTGVAGEYWGRFEKKDKNIVLTTNAPKKDFWVKYLDIERDYSKIKNAVAINDFMKAAVEYGGGIRILRQDFFEALISFVISQRSSIAKIKSTVKKLCETYGRKLEAEGNIYYTFPTPEELKDVTEADFRALGTGYRAPYLVSCVKAVIETNLTEEAFMDMSTAKAREKLIALHGVGDKVCDCVLLFSLAKYDLFPSDVWIKRVMSESFGSSEQGAKNAGEKLFGGYSGFAQQYLFYYRRNLK